MKVYFLVTWPYDRILRGEHKVLYISFFYSLMYHICEKKHYCTIFFFFDRVQLMAFALDDHTHYHQTKIPIGFRCRWRLSYRFYIQQIETLPVELTRTYHIIIHLLVYFVYTCHLFHVLNISPISYVVFF